MKRPELVKWARSICLEYQEKGYGLTLRQLYYQGVTRLVFASGQKSYDRLKDTLSDARMKGDFPLNWVDDRTRVVYPGRTTRNDSKVSRALERAAEQLRAAPDHFLFRDRWFAQETHVSVWFEKEALSEVFERACQELGVSWLACKGDPSHAALYDWLQHTAAACGIHNGEGWKDRSGNNHAGKAKRAVILYFGDHDPTGIRIPRTAEATLARFLELTKVHLPIEMRRVGVTMQQAEEMDLPSFPAKESAGQDFTNYVEEFGTEEAWELDALPPDVLTSMIHDAVNPYFDLELFGTLQEGIEQRRQSMRKTMLNPDWARRALEET